MWLTAALLVLACVLVVPWWLVRWELGAQARALTAADKAKAINDVRTTLLQGIGGTVLLLGFRCHGNYRPAVSRWRLLASKHRSPPSRLMSSSPSPSKARSRAVQPRDRAAR